MTAVKQVLLRTTAGIPADPLDIIHNETFHRDQMKDIENWSREELIAGIRVWAEGLDERSAQVDELKRMVNKMLRNFQAIRPH